MSVDLLARSTPANFEAISGVRVEYSGTQLLLRLELKSQLQPEWLKRLDRAVLITQTVATPCQLRWIDTDGNLVTAEILRHERTIAGDPCSIGDRSSTSTMLRCAGAAPLIPKRTRPLSTPSACVTRFRRTDAANPGPASSQMRAHFFMSEKTLPQVRSRHLSFERGWSPRKERSVAVF
jgi:hypothetical protein